MVKKMQRTCDRILVAIFPSRTRNLFVRIYLRVTLGRRSDEESARIWIDRLRIYREKLNFAIDASIENFVDRLIFLIRLKRF